MGINVQNYNRVAVIELQGEIDGEFAGALKDSVTHTVAERGTGIVLNLNDVSFIDGQGLELLLWVRDYCRRHKIQLRLAGLDENCEKILEITRLAHEFDRHTELAEAVKSFA
jgi:anti-anti-sigma factor